MSFLQKLRQTFGGGSNDTSPSSFYDVQVRCRRCGEILTARINLANDLSMDYECKTYHVRKLLVGTGANRCFERVELELTFDAGRQLLHREAIGGTFVDSLPADTGNEGA
jgi:hypothetical protein